MTSPVLLPTAETPNTGFGFDIFQQLLKQRIVFLGQQVDDTIANALAAQILYLAGQDNDKEIWLYVNSPGGSVTAGMAIYDTMQFVKPDVATVCLGLGASMGQFLLTAGAPGKRYALPHSRILMHQPSAGVQGQAADIAIQAENLINIKKEMAQLIADHSGQDVERIIEDSDRDKWFTADEAKEYGLLDHVITRSGELTGD
jgi:ATP-dependent Clp protease protease subunit